MSGLIDKLAPSRNAERNKCVDVESAGRFVFMNLMKRDGEKKENLDISLEKKRGNDACDVFDAVVYKNGSEVKIKIKSTRLVFQYGNGKGIKRWALNGGKRTAFAKKKRLCDVIVWVCLPEICSDNDTYWKHVKLMRSFFSEKMVDYSPGVMYDEMRYVDYCGFVIDSVRKKKNDSNSVAFSGVIGKSRSRREFANKFCWGFERDKLKAKLRSVMHEVVSKKYRSVGDSANKNNDFRIIYHRGRKK